MPSLTPADTTHYTAHTAHYGTVASRAVGDIRATRSISVASSSRASVRISARSVLADVKMQSDTAVRRIQCAWRQAQRRRKMALMRALQRKLDERLWRKRHSAVVAIQYWWRITRMRRLRVAVLRIGAAWRSYQVRQGVAFCLRAIISIQRVWRARRIRHHALIVAQCRMRCRNRLKNYYLLMLLVSRYQAATRLQSAYRAHARRKAYRAYNNAARRVQRAWRRYREQCCEWRAATRIQRVVRAFIARRQRINLLRTRQDAAVVLQRWVRMRHARHSFVQRRSAQRRIATWWKRRVLVRMRRVRAAECIQRAWHHYIRHVLEPVRDHAHQCRHAATRIQAIWRMHAVRTRVNTAGVHILTTNDRRGPRGGRAIVHVFRRFASKEWRMVEVTQTADGIESEELIFANDESADAATQDTVREVARRLVAARAPQMRLSVDNQYSNAEGCATKSEFEHDETGATAAERTNGAEQRGGPVANACWEDLTPHGSEAVVMRNNEQNGQVGANGPPVAAQIVSTRENVVCVEPIEEGEEEKRESVIEQQKHQPEVQAEQQPQREQQQQHPQKGQQEPPEQQEQQEQNQQQQRGQEPKTGVRDNEPPVRSKNTGETTASPQREKRVSAFLLSCSSSFSPSSSSSSSPPSPPVSSNPTDGVPATTRGDHPQTPHILPHKEAPALDTEQSSCEVLIPSTWMEFLNRPLVPTSQEAPAIVSAREAPSVTSEAIDEVVMGLEHLAARDRGRALSSAPVYEPHEERNDRHHDRDPHHDRDIARASAHIPRSTASWESRQGHVVVVPRGDEVAHHAQSRQRDKFPHNDEEGEEPEPMEEPEDDAQSLSALMLCYLEPAAPAVQEITIAVSPRTPPVSPGITREWLSDLQGGTHVAAAYAAKSSVSLSGGLPWKCSHCDFVNEVSPKQCVMCDGLRNCEATSLVTPVQRGPPRLQRPRSACDIRLRANNLTRDAHTSKKRQNITGGRIEKLTYTSNLAAHVDAPLARPRSALIRKPPVPRATRCSSSRVF